MLRAIAIVLLAASAGLAAEMLEKKVTEFKVCTPFYTDLTDTVSKAGGTDLFTCGPDNLATTTKVGTFTYHCGQGTLNNGQNGLRECIVSWDINGCFITRIGVNPIGGGPRTRNNWFVTADPGAKCPKAKNIKSFSELSTYVVPGQEFPAAEQYTITYWKKDWNPLWG